MHYIAQQRWARSPSGSGPSRGPAPKFLKAPSKSSCAFKVWLTMSADNLIAGLGPGQIANLAGCLDNFDQRTS